MFECAVPQPPAVNHYIRRRRFSILTSLSLYIIVYLVIYPIGLYLMLQRVWFGPVSGDSEAPIQAGRPKGPIEALPATAD